MDIVSDIDLSVNGLVFGNHMDTVNNIKDFPY